MMRPPDHPMQAHEAIVHVNYYMEQHALYLQVGNKHEADLALLYCRTVLLNYFHPRVDGDGKHDPASVG